MWGGTQHDKTTHETEKDQRALLPGCLLHAGPADAVDTDYMLTVLHTAHKSHRSRSLGEMNEVSGLEHVPALAHQQGPQAEAAGVPSTC